MSRFKSVMPDNWGIVFASFASAYGVGLISLISLPFLMSAIMSDLKLDEAQAGFLISAEFLLMVISSLLIAPVMGKIPKRTATLIATVIIIVANLASANVTDVYLLTFIRCVSGFAGGIALACGNACVSLSSDPDKTAAYMNVLFVALMIIVMLTFSRVLSAYGLAGVYYALAINTIIMLLFVFKMPNRVESLEHTQEAISQEKVKMLTPVAISMMLAMFIFSMRDTMGWAFSWQVGLNVGYTDEQLGTIFSLQAFIGLAGPFIAGLIGAKYGLKMPMLLAIVSTGAVSMGYILGEYSKTMYTISVLLIVLTYFYALAYFTALAAKLDKEGKIVAASSSFLTLGIAVGPAFSGWLLSVGGFPLVATSVAVLVVLTFVCVILPLKAISSSQKSAVVKSMPATPSLE